MNRRQFFANVFAIAAVFVLLRSRVARYIPTTRSLQWMLDHGVPIPPGHYTIDRPLYIRRSRTEMRGLGLTATHPGYMVIIDRPVKDVVIADCGFTGAGVFQTHG